MPRAPLLLLTAVLAVAPAACGSGAPSANPPTRTIAPSPSPSPSLSLSPSVRPPNGAGLTGRTVVLNCPVDRADPPCPSTPVPARVVVLNQTGRTTLATVESDADGLFTVPLPAGSYVIRASGLGGSTARRPAIRPVTVSAGRYTTVTIRLITGLR